MVWSREKYMQKGMQKLGGAFLLTPPHTLTVRHFCFQVNKVDLHTVLVASFPLPWRANKAHTSTKQVTGRWEGSLGGRRMRSMGLFSWFHRDRVLDRDRGRDSVCDCVEEGIPDGS